MANVIPIWTDGVAVIPATTVSFGNTVRGTIDLRVKFGAMLSVRLGRKGSAAPSAALSVACCRILSNDAPGGAHPTAVIPLQGGNASGAATTVNADSAAGQAVVHVASSVGFAAGDLVCLYDAGFTRLEFGKVSKVAAGLLTLQRPLGFAHLAADADNVTRQAEVFAPFWLHGGSIWEVIVDYGAATSGADYVAQAIAQTYDSDSIL